MNNSSKIIALTPGSENGVGPELLLKALAEVDSDEQAHFIWCSDKASLKLASQRSLCAVDFLDGHKARINHHTVTFFPFGFDHLGPVERQALSLKKSVELALNDQISAIVTGPIEKSALAYLDDGKYPGQTEYFARHLAKPNSLPFMAFLGGPFMLSLLSTHTPLKNVASLITKDRIIAHLKAAADECGLLLNKHSSDVKIALLGLNPHAGEHGLLGHEEKEIIIPAMIAARELSLTIEGPWPADGFFSYFHTLSASQIPDLVVATYHDQGLIPYKLLTKGCSVNVTLGLTIPRISPSHGTAPHLVGTEQACIKSSKEAIKTALKLA